MLLLSQAVDIFIIIHGKIIVSLSRLHRRPVSPYPLRSLMVLKMVPEQQIPFSWQPGEIKLSGEGQQIWISKT